MSLIRFEKNPPKIVLRLMGLFFALFFGLVGALAAFGFGTWTTATWLWGVGGALAVVYYAIPPLRRPLYLGWMYAAAPLGWVIIHTIMALVYFGVLTPVALLMRRLGHDPLQRRFEADKPSYWVEHDNPGDLDHYFRQY